MFLFRVLCHYVYPIDYQSWKSDILALCSQDVLPDIPGVGKQFLDAHVWTAVDSKLNPFRQEMPILVFS